MLEQMSFETQMKQASLTAAQYLSDALDAIEKYDIHPCDSSVIIAALINASALDYQAANITRLVNSINIARFR